ncbi:MAG: VWA domain-containing protein [Vicinamibacterales bacterium]
MRRLPGPIIVAVLAAASAVAARQPTFRAGVDLTTFGVSIVDKKGGLVTSLERDAFEIFEDGHKQELKFFARGDGDAIPELHLGLLLDTSGSMTDELKLARSAAVKFLNLLPDARDITLVDFDTQVRITRYPQRDFARMVERIRMRKAEGLTALYDALGTYLDGADDQPGRKIMVMYTDGGDTRSALTFDDTLTLLKASQVTVYAVGLVERTGSARLELQMRMRQLAEATGGEAFFPQEMKAVEGAYDKVLAEINGQYHLGYVSTNAATDGAWRKVEIKVKRPDLKVRARKGYFAPYAP